MKAKTIKFSSVAILALCASAQAASISFNSVGGLTGGMADTDTAGKVSVANWNNMNTATVSSGAITGSLSAGTVVDSSGTTLTTTTVNWSGTGQVLTSTGAGSNDLKMFTSEWDLFNGAMTITVTDIPYAQYDVYYYVQDASNANDRGGDVDANGTLESIMMFNSPSGDGTPYVEANTAGTYSSSTDRGTYLRLENITGSTLTLGITAKKPAGTDIDRLRMTGFQIVEVVPEPSAALLAFLGSSLLIFSRRRD